MCFKRYSRSLVLFFIVLVVISGGIKYYQKVQEDKRNKAIIVFCEQYRWDDGQRNQDNWDLDGKKLIGKTDFLCSEYLYLKPKVKKSRTNICHAEDSTYYYKTKLYKIFTSVDDCLNSGGRLPYN